jgi:hypothetical protein
MAPDLPPPTDTYYPWVTGTAFTNGYYCNTTSNYSSNYSPRLEPIYYYDRLVRSFQKFLSETDKALLREMNFKPTREGIDNTERFHSMIVFATWATPWFSVRFDRRIPCWRAGRWKSLT